MAEKGQHLPPIPSTPAFAILVQVIFHSTENMWTRYIQNPEELETLFNPLLDLSEIELIDVELMNQSTDVHLRFDIAMFPKNPPNEWEGRNRIQIELVIARPEALEIKGWKYPLKGALKAVEKDGWIKIDFDSENCQFSCNTQSPLHIIKISAYSKAD